jgi:polyribonucleotide nucleotidyltransferase
MALSVSDIPFEGPISATRVGYIDGEYIMNPTYAQITESTLDVLVASSRDGVVMMEAGASQVAESIVLEAIKRAHEYNQPIIAFQDEMKETIGKPTAEFQVDAYPVELDEKLTELLNGKIAQIFETSPGKSEQGSMLRDLQTEALNAFAKDYEDKHILAAFDWLLEEEFKVAVLDRGLRPDGRSVKEIRPLAAEVALLPRVHGSSLFTRGETQILGVTTLGSVGDAQRIENLTPETSKRFMLHYNFPPYSVGEVRRMGGPGRREIGHGVLAEKALIPVLPDEKEFPYTIRIVCEALGSNGSTSMGSVCAGTMALQDAGVPIKAPVAGISIGLVQDDQGRHVTLTDIQGLEDHVGEMDFKVAGTPNGVTAIQLDIKAKSISMAVVEDALTQAKEARETIFAVMEKAISGARPELSPYAPRMLQISIPVDKIGTVIGPGGKMIRSIVEKTGATIDIQDDGTVIIGSADGAAAQAAMQMIDDLTREVKAGDIYTGRVVRLMNFGAFVEILPGRDGMVHISELAEGRVEKVEDVVDVGDEITVMVIEIDQMGRINLSRRALLEGAPQGENGEFVPRPPRGAPVGGGGQRGGGGRGGPRGGGSGGPRRGGYGGGRS